MKQQSASARQQWRFLRFSDQSPSPTAIGPTLEPIFVSMAAPVRGDLAHSVVELEENRVREAETQLEAGRQSRHFRSTAAGEQELEEKANELEEKEVKLEEKEVKLREKEVRLRELEEATRKREAEIRIKAGQQHKLSRELEKKTKKQQEKEAELQVWAENLQAWDTNLRAKEWLQQESEPLAEKTILMEKVIRDRLRQPPTGIVGGSMEAQPAWSPSPSLPSSPANHLLSTRPPLPYSGTYSLRRATTAQSSLTITRPPGNEAGGVGL